MTETRQQAEAVRQFNRFYTQQIGVLQEGLLNSPYSLTEARILYELEHLQETTATKLSDQLSLDAGYLSRILRRFQKDGLLDKKRSPTDGRQSTLSLTAQGQEAFTMLDRRSRQEIEGLLQQLSLEERQRLLKAMQAIQTLLSSNQQLPSLLRPHQPGDMGWIVHRHAVIYSEEYGWNDQFEALVAEIVAAFIRNYAPRKERCWIAEMDGENVGCVFVVKQSETIAKLRLLLVEPRARGLGIGTRLIDESIKFARRSGYQKLTLWTNSVLQTARHLYQKAGFRLVAENAHHSFGCQLVGQTWEREL
ncbi:MAG: GNAT family N-acetyltransferase [Cyanophyceae cyanobacterium]